MKSQFANERRIRGVDALLSASFFLSGFCALLYQVCWQRSLYSIIGVDTDSVTIIVSVFMLGIGFGGILGGWISDAAPRQRIQIYAIAELSIALYGISSIALLSRISNDFYGLNNTSWGSGATSFIFLIVPTVLMGITLPLLTMAFNVWKNSIGVSVGQLYFLNTLGASFGAGAVPFVLLPHFSLDDVVRFAAFGNGFVALAALSSHRLIARKKVETT